MYEHVEKDNLGRVISKINYTDETKKFKHGPEEYYNPETGEKTHSTNWDFNTKHGEEREYNKDLVGITHWESGKKLSNFNYKKVPTTRHGETLIPHGSWVSYHHNGSIMSHTSYEDGEESKPKINYRSDGSILNASFYGKRSNETPAYYFDNGKFKIESLNLTGRSIPGITLNKTTKKNSLNFRQGSSQHNIRRDPELASTMGINDKEHLIHSIRSKGQEIIHAFGYNPSSRIITHKVTQRPTTRWSQIEIPQHVREGTEAPKVTIPPSPEIATRMRGLEIKPTVISKEPDKRILQGMQKIGRFKKLEIPEHLKSEKSLVVYKSYRQEDINRANKTSRNRGAVGEEAVTPKHVRKIASKTDEILDYGSGADAAHALKLQKEGYNTTAHDFGKNQTEGLHDRNALNRKYDIVYASNVLNIQSNENMMRTTLGEIKNAVKPTGVFVGHYPKNPRHSDLTNDQVLSMVGEHFPNIKIIKDPEKKRSPLLFEARFK